MSVISMTLGVIMIWAGFFANLIPPLLLPLAGALLGVSITCWMALRKVEQVLDAVVEEERLRLSQIN
ncbi:hypothetical protein [Deinococcus sp. Leaf326]|uniref:hypothetical protein n=1 Tax=Deinococcus sp. Leaf326 TaxID=1736338 RepID=UPI0012E29C24|nr:hypothetical protein [Deinococcus sp. Leaf326]